MNNKPNVFWCLLSFVLLLLLNSTPSFAGFMGQLPMEEDGTTISVYLGHVDRRMSRIGNTPMGKPESEARTKFVMLHGIYPMSSGGLMPAGLPLTHLKGGIGVSGLEVDRREGPYFHGDNSLMWTAGLASSFLTWDFDGVGFLLGVNTNFRRQRGHSGTWSGHPEGGTAPHQNNVVWWEWDVGVQGQVAIGKFVGYVGARYSDARLKYVQYRGLKGPFTEQAADHVGGYAGGYYTLGEYFRIFGESGFTDETSAFAGVEYMF